jgi:hypothetical protein
MSATVHMAARPIDPRRGQGHAGYKLDHISNRAKDLMRILGLKANILNKQVAMAPKIWANCPLVALTFEAFCSSVSFALSAKMALFQSLPKIVLRAVRSFSEALVVPTNSIRGSFLARGTSFSGGAPQSRKCPFCRACPHGCGNGNKYTALPRPQSFHCLERNSGQNVGNAGKVPY